MKKYSNYKKIRPAYFNWSESLAMPALPITAISLVTYGILYFLGFWPAVVANVIVSMVINHFYHGLKNATPNGSMHVQGKSKPLLSMTPSFLVILGILLTANVGVYLIVLYQKTGVFYTNWFIIWCFVVFGLPILYHLSLKLKYLYGIYYQAYVFTSVPLNIIYDPELLIYIKEISFLNVDKKRMASVDLNSQKNLKHLHELNTIPVSQKNDLLYDVMFGGLTHIPKHTNVLKIIYYSVPEECYYSDEIVFPYRQLKFVQNKYPLNKSEFLRGKSAENIILRIQKGGKINLYNKYDVLIPPVQLSKQLGNKEEHEKMLKQYMSLHWSKATDENVFTYIQKVKTSESVEKRNELTSGLFNWKLAGDGLEKQEIMLKDVKNCFLSDDILEADVVKKRHLPICFKFSYEIYTWFLIHIDAEKLYDTLYPLYLNDTETVFTFYVSICLEEGNISLVIKNNNTDVPFSGWEKELITHWWEDAKKKKLKKKENDTKQAVLNEIYELMEQKSYLKAQEICKREIQQRPDFAMLYFYEARLLWYTQGYEISYAQEGYFIEKTAHDAYALSRIYNHYGCLLDEEHRYKEALPYFEKAAQTYPKEVIYTANVAEIYYKLKEASQALHYANECSDRDYTSDMITDILKNKGVMNIPENSKTIDDLEIELSNLAMKYRSAEENSTQHYDALNAYHTTFKELTKLNGGIKALDPDAELPDHLMPKEYVDYWLNDNKRENN